MRIVRRAFAVVGMLAAAGLVARAQEPKAGADGESAIPAAGRSVVCAMRNLNVVPSTFRAQLVTDGRFAPKTDPPKDDSDRDPRDRTGKIHCLVCEHGLSPVVAVFVRGDVSKYQKTDGLSKLLKGADDLIPLYRGDKLATFAMFLKLEVGKQVVPVAPPDPADAPKDDPKEEPRGCGALPKFRPIERKPEDKNVAVDFEYPHDEKRAEKVAEVLNYAGVVGAKNVPFGLAAEKSAALDAFGIGDAPVTVIIYNRMRMVRRWELKPDELTDERVAEILAAAEEMIRGKKAVQP